MINAAKLPGVRERHVTHRLGRLRVSRYAVYFPDSRRLSRGATFDVGNDSHDRFGWLDMQVFRDPEFRGTFRISYNRSAVGGKRRGLHMHFEV